MITPYPDLSPPVAGAVLRPEPPRLSRSGIEFRARLQHARGERTLWFRSPLEGGASFTARADPFVLAVLPHCMRLGLNLEVDGCVTRGLIQNLADFQEALGPRRLGWSQVEITAAGEIAAPEGPRRAGLIALTGDLDDAYSLFRHSALSPHRPKRPLAAVLFVQGADGSRSDAAATRRAGCAAMARSVGLPLVTVETNLREPVSGGREWRALQLAAALTLFQEDFTTGVIGGTEEGRGRRGGAAARLWPWSSDAFHVVEDAASIGAREKLRHLAAWPTGRRHLRVCRSGAASNCGRCERCVRTRVWIEVLATPPWDAFPEPLSAATFRELVVNDEGALADLATALRSLRERGARTAWLRPARWCVLRSRWQRKLRSLRQKLVPRRRRMGPTTASPAGVRRPVLS